LTEEIFLLKFLKKEMIRHLILDNKWKKIIFVSSAFLITGIILNVHVYLTDCKRAIRL